MLKKSNSLIKYLVITIIILFIGTSFFPLICGDILSEKNVDLRMIQIGPLKDEDIIFFDDFNDNKKDYDKWTECYSDGIWDEKNQRCEFQLYEPGNGNSNEGIKSNEFVINLNPFKPLIIKWDILCDIDSTNWAGAINFKVTDGINWLLAKYSRWTNSTMFIDSNDEKTTYINQNKPWDIYSNEIHLYINRYYVIMDGESSGPVYDSLFEAENPITFQIYLESSGKKPLLYFRSGFDNIKVSFPEETPTKKALIFGRIKNLNNTENFAMFEAVNTRVITIFPYSTNTYTSGESIVILKPKYGILANSFIIGLFNLAI